MDTGIWMIMLVLMDGVDDAVEEVCSDADWPTTLMSSAMGLFRSACWALLPTTKIAPTMMTVLAKVSEVFSMAIGPIVLSLRKILKESLNHSKKGCLEGVLARVERHCYDAATIRGSGRCIKQG